MKKIILAISLISAMNASEISDKVSSFIKDIVKDSSVDIEVTAVNKVADSNFEMVEFNIVKDGNILGSDVFFSDGVYGTTTLVNMKTKEDFKADYMVKKENEKRIALEKKLSSYVKENQDIVIDLGNHKSDVATVVFSDPDCPWCRKHLENIEEDLKKSNIKLILSPLPMHENALSKSINILDEIKSAKTDADKIKVLRKYFKDGVEFKEPNQSKKDTYNAKVKSMFEMGVNYTPAIFENIKIK